MEQQAETVQEVQEDKGLLANASAEAETTREEPVGEPESIPHRAEDVQAKIPDRPDYVPEKFWNKEQGKIREKDVFKSFTELEKNFHKDNIKPRRVTMIKSWLMLVGWIKVMTCVGAYTEWAKENGISQKTSMTLLKKSSEWLEKESKRLNTVRKKKWKNSVPTPKKSSTKTSSGSKAWKEKTSLRRKKSKP